MNKQQILAFLSAHPDWVLRHHVEGRWYATALDGSDAKSLDARSAAAASKSLQEVPGPNPYYVDFKPALKAAPAEVWQAALTLAHNLCVQISDDFNADDETSEAIAALSCAKEIRRWIDISGSDLRKMLEKGR